MSESIPIPTTLGTGAETPAPPDQQPTGAERGWGEYLEREGEHAVSKLDSARRFAKRLHGDRFNDEVSEPDPEYGVRGNNPDWVAEHADRAREIDAAEAILGPGRDVLELAKSTTQLDAAIDEVRAKHPRAWRDTGHQDYKRVNAALDVLYRLRAAHRIPPAAMHLGSPSRGPDPIAAFRKEHAAVLLNPYHAEHKQRHSELEQLYAAKGE